MPAIGEPDAAGRAAARRYAYWGMPLLLELLGTPLVSGFLLFMAVRAHIVGIGHPLWFRALLMLGGTWGIGAAVRRSTSPTAFEITGSTIRAIYLGGRSHQWQLAQLQIMPRRFGAFGDSATTVVDTDAGRLAFRMFKRLPGYEELCQTIENARARGRS